MRLKISARSSHLARLQAYAVGRELQKKNSYLQIEFFFRESLGDKNLTDPLWKMPEKGVFTEDFYQDIIEEKTDLVVHSWKDLPTERLEDTMICATLLRADQRDLLLFKKSSLKRLEKNESIHILSSSQRRIYNLQNFLKEVLPFQPEKIQFKDVRGNIPTRLEKLVKVDEIDGLILAKAAIDRLLDFDHPEFVEIKQKLRNLIQDLDFMVLPLTENPNAAAQGSLAIEVKKSRTDIINLIQEINDSNTFECSQKEREILASYGGGCHQKIGISVLRRNFGDIYFLKGLTDSNETLNLKKIELTENFKHPVLSSHKFSLSEVPHLFERSEVPFEISKEIKGILVSRISAYQKFHGYVWAAGIETWKKLAKKNIWVHGCSESLGESELPRLDVLSGTQINWTKLTHKDADPSEMKSIATYQLRLKLDLPAEALKAENFFWMSAYQFDLVTNKYPELLQKTHCCGLGQTFNALTKRLAPHGKKPYLFLNEFEWRNHE